MGRKNWGIAIGALFALASLRVFSHCRPSATNAAPFQISLGYGTHLGPISRPPPSGGPAGDDKTRTFYMRIGDEPTHLKPQAAEEVRKAGVISRNRVNFPTPSNQCTPWSPPYAWRALQMQILSRRIRSSFSMSAISKSATCFERQHPQTFTPSWGGDSSAITRATRGDRHGGVKVGPLSRDRQLRHRPTVPR